METLQVALISAKIVVSIGVLIYASWSDYKTREVRNRVWAHYAPIALVLSLTEILLFDVSMLPFMALSFGLTTAFALLLFYTGGFGGADSKALMCIALALAFSTEAVFTPLLGASISPISQYIFPLTIFSNSVLFAAASGVYMILRIIIWHNHEGKKMFEGSLTKESIWKKLLVLITGYPMKVGVLVAKWHVFPMEDVDDATGDRKLVIVPNEDGRDGIIQRLNKAVEEKRIGDYVWATPGLPMLIFVTLGLVVAVFFGDIVWLLVQAILG